MSSEEKQFAPTLRHRQKMREEGHVALSRDLVNATTLLVAAGALYGLGGSMLWTLRSGLENSFLAEPWTQMSVEHFMDCWRDGMKMLCVGFLPFFLLIPATILLTSLIQTRFLFLTSNLLPDWKKIHPVNGLGRIFSWNACVIAFLGIGKIALIGSILGWILVSQLENLLLLPTQAFPDAVATLFQFVLLTGLKVAGVLFLLALADYGWQVWRHEQSLRMTLQEMREEQKATESNPQLRAQMREQSRIENR